jgi:hypothetical protein
MTVSEIDDTNRTLYARYKEMEPTMKRVAEQKKLYDAIRAWNERDVNWLDEMRDLSIRFPGPRDAVVLRMSMRFSSDSGGLIDLHGLVRDPKVLATMEQQVRDGKRKVRSRRIQERTLEHDYTWMYETSMAVAARSKDQYVSHLPPLAVGAEDDEVADGGEEPTDEGESDGDGEAVPGARAKVAEVESP